MIEFTHVNKTSPELLVLHALVGSNLYFDYTYLPVPLFGCGIFLKGELC